MKIEAEYVKMRLADMLMPFAGIKFDLLTALKQALCVMI